MKMTDKIFARKIAGSALILVVVLTSLLAIVGVMFVMVARVDRIATSAISENKTLDYAVEAVIARISQELVLDVPGAAGAEYYDYPGQRDRWLASLEPHKDGGYKWRQISDVTGYIGPAARRNVDVDIIEDHRKIELDPNGNIEDEEFSGGQLADADGDGVADSKWIELDDITSGKGKTIYAAIRVIDNGGMLNVNTAYQFNPASPGPDGEYIDGSDQMQINLLALAQRSASNKIEDLDNARFGDELHHDMDRYLRDVVWRYNEPNGRYTPFDISDELELRNRFSLNRSDVDSRIEQVWRSAFRALNYLRTPVDSPSSLGDWEEEVCYEASDVNDVNTYSYRHIGTTYNMDRIINPYGGRMVNVNREVGVYDAIKLALFTADPNFKDIDETAAQIAANLVAFHDGAGDPNVYTTILGGKIYYGFTRPCVYISELAHKFVEPYFPPGLPRPEGYINRSYAIELHKPYREDKYPDANMWQLRIEGYGTFPVDWSGTRSFHVMLFEHQNVPLEGDVDFDLADVDPNLPPPLAEETQNLRTGTVVFAPRKTISLERRVDRDRDIWVTVDSVTVQYGPGPPYKVWDIDGQVHSYQRDITLHKNIRRLWDNLFTKEDSETLGSNNVYETGDSIYIQAHPANRDFTNVGEIGMVFRKGAYYINDIDRPDRIGYGLNKDEEQVRLDLADPNYRNLFQYLTVFDPTRDRIDNDGDGGGEGAGFEPDELKIPGRININTAPWYVIAQLPWMTDKIAQAIVAYRDKLDMDPNGPDYYHVNANNSRYQETGIRGLREADGFASIGELATVINNSDEDDYSMRYYALDSDDLAGFPDLTPGGSTADGAEDDFEERDVIFARISNLVTVRSDVFTAYILVRIGADGPQKRVMAILDRSNVYPPEGGKVRIVALHAVADPR